MRASLNALGVRLPARSADATVIDAFLVSGVGSVLLIRIALEAAGYPQLGGGGLHIAHMLWGGLGMLVAILLLLLFVGPGTRMTAAVVGGAGFGAFIDELGKFVTSDNDYFFQPTAVLIYAIFMILFLIVRELRSFRGLSEDERLANAIELSENLAMGSLTEGDRERALHLLQGANQKNSMVIALQTRFNAAQPRTVRAALFRRVGGNAVRRYASLVSNRWFRRVVAVVFLLQGISLLTHVLGQVVVLFADQLGIDASAPEFESVNAAGTFASWTELFAALIADVLIFAGLWALRRSRRRAYRAFELAVLVDLLLVRPFALLDVGFPGAADVLFDLALLLTLRYMRAQEQALARGPVVPETPAPYIAAAEPTLAR